MTRMENESGEIGKKWRKRGKKRKWRGVKNKVGKRKIMRSGVYIYR